MNKKLFICLPLALVISSCSFFPFSKKNSGSSSSVSTSASSSSTPTDPDEYDNQGRLILNLKNLYFEQWDGSDVYTEYINGLFDVNINPSSYEYYSWDEMVNMQVNADQLTDVFHFNLRDYNFGSTYEHWVKENVLKPLPNNLSQWPYLEYAINRTSNIDALKVDGELYCLPLQMDIGEYDKDFSNFTYVYRKDWAKQIDSMYTGNPEYVPVCQDDDVYTWEEFNRLLVAFKTHIETLASTNQASALVDESWGFPSVANFYRESPYCFTKNDNGEAINAFTTDKMIEGLNAAKSFVENGYYSTDQYVFTDGTANQQYRAGRAAILYDNWTYQQYSSLKKKMKKNQPSINIDDATAIMQVKGPDGKFALQGQENWFSATMFNSRISDNKMYKILDIINYLLSEEGTRFAVYGMEGTDYYFDNDGNIALFEDAWPKDADGNYIEKVNGARYLRYMGTIGNELISYAPYFNAENIDPLIDWQKYMHSAKYSNLLRIVKEPSDISWMSTPTKNDRVQSMLHDGNTFVLRYAYNQTTLEGYYNSFNTANWNKCLQEINERLGK